MDQATGAGRQLRPQPPLQQHHRHLELVGARALAHRVDGGPLVRGADAYGSFRRVLSLDFFLFELTKKVLFVLPGIGATLT